MDDDEDVTNVPPAEWSWGLPVFTSLATLSSIFDSIAQGLSDTALGVVRHMNYRIVQKQFEQDASAAIERIVSNT